MNAYCRSASTGSSAVATAVQTKDETKPDKDQTKPSSTFRQTSLPVFLDSSLVSAVAKMVRQRHQQRRAAEPTSSSPAATPAPAAAPRVITEKGNMAFESRSDDDRRALLGSDGAGTKGLDIAANKMSFVGQNKWIGLAIASGACAAFNGVFAKL